ncbi:MAG TPA: hypothetical protein VIH90_01735 [Candidatus Saccharimonadales bacterium]
MNKTVAFLKERWWIILLVAIVAVLLLIPTKAGLPDKNYKGCENTDPQYTSYCVTTKIKNISQESNGSISFTVPIEFKEGTDDVTFHLKKDRGLKVGDTVFINLAEWDKKAYLFINSDSNLFVTILSHVFESSQGATAKIDLNTMQEI